MYSTNMILFLIIGVIQWIVQATLVIKAGVLYHRTGRHDGISLTPGWAAILFLSLYFILA